jgi:AmmeMemoRadiSam system protein B
MFVREYKFAGRFYPEDKRVLVSMLQDMYQKCDSCQEKIRPRGILLPHAAYKYSGLVAMAVLKCIETPENVIILAPNHSGLGEDVSIISSGKFSTPIGDVFINSDIARLIIKNVPQVIEDRKAHIIEHSVEVQLPLLKYLRNDIKIVPVLIKKMVFDHFIRFVSKFKEFILKNPLSDILFVSTSDLSHYENYEETERKDRLVLEHIKRMDIMGLRNCIEREKIRICGFESIALNIEVCKSLGASSVIIKKYDTSKSYDYDCDRVVGYAGVCFV